MPQTTVVGWEGIPGRARKLMGALFTGRRRGSALWPESGENTLKAELLLGGP